MADLPNALAPLAPIRERLMAILDLLGQEEEPVVRADLATELVGTSANYLDVNDRAVYPVLPSVPEDVLGNARDQQVALREALGDLRHRTQNVKPSDVYADDPEGFEQTLDAVIKLLRRQIKVEDVVLYPTLNELSEGAAHDLQTEVDSALSHASNHPNPPQNPVGRAVVAMGEKLNRGLHDESTAWHPGLEKLDETLDPSSKGT